jgi:DNA-binding response OmpR family regulator
MHLLLVEDEDAIRSALVRGLASGGNTVDGAASLAEARAKAAVRRPDVLVTDLKLPDGLGLDLAQELGVPFVQMTGYGTFDDAVRAIRLGCIDFFTKPVSLRDLRRALERIPGRAVGTVGTQLFDPAGGVILQVSGDRPERRRFAVQAVEWADEAGACSAWQSVRSVGSTLRQRQLLAELLRLVPSGRLVVNRDDLRWIAWLDTGDLMPDGRDHPDGRARLEQLAKRICWLADGGVLVEDLAQAAAAYEPAAAEPDPGTGWYGELLWPHSVAEAAVIDLAAVTACGTWLYAWFRAHPGQAVVGARPEIRRQLEQAGLAILFRDPRSIGVTSAERADLLG